MTATDDLRQRFEHWYSDEGKWPQAVAKDGGGDYLLLQAALSWKAWQAADASAQVARGVREKNGNG
jgi:hypothetical protein